MNWQEELISYVNRVPFGDVRVDLVRKNRDTKFIRTYAEETLRYVNTDEAIDDLNKMFDKLIKGGFTGEAHVKLSMDNGEIKMTSIFNKKETEYKDGKKQN